MLGSASPKARLRLTASQSLGLPPANASAKKENSKEKAITSKPEGEGVFVFCLGLINNQEEFLLKKQTPPCDSGNGGFFSVILPSPTGVT